MGSFLNFFKHLTTLPWQKSMVHEPIQQLLNADITLRDEMTRRWVQAKLDELSFVGLTVSRLRNILPPHSMLSCE